MGQAEWGGHYIASSVPLGLLLSYTCNMQVQLSRRK
jgi:hypothetical protein